MSQQHAPATEQQLSDQHARFMRMVERNLLAAKVDKLTGEISFKAVLRDGGLMDSYKEIRAREK